jgi:hypothetical protein
MLSVCFLCSSTSERLRDLKLEVRSAELAKGRPNGYSNGIIGGFGSLPMCLPSLSQPNLLGETRFSQQKLHIEPQMVGLPVGRGAALLINLSMSPIVGV